MSETLRSVTYGVMVAIGVEVYVEHGTTGWWGFLAWVLVSLGVAWARTYPKKDTP